MSARIWIPGSGMVDLAIRRVLVAVQEYDERLTFGRNEDTGQWTIYLFRDRDEPPFPILAFEGAEPPHPEDAVKRLYRMDALRRGEEILDEVNRNNASIRQKYEDKASDASGLAAEALEWGYRQMGAHPSPRVFVPRSI